MNFVDYKKEYIDVLKTRIESLDISDELINKLLSKNIRTVGGLISPTETELKKILKISDQDIGQLRLEVGYLISKEKLVRNSLPINELTEVNIQKPSEAKSDLKLIIDKEKNIIEFFSKQLGCNLSDILNDSRKVEIVNIRKLITYLLREYDELSFVEIGRMLGRDHSTIIHLYNSFKKKISEGKILEEEMQQLINKFIEFKDLNAQSINTDNIFYPEVSNYSFKEISEKDQMILDLYKQKVTQRNIAKRYGISAQWVTQIIAKTLRQQIINNFILNNLELTEEILNKENAYQKEIIKESKKKIKTLIKREHTWSRNYSACKSCGTTLIPHAKFGLCEKCTGGFRGERREKIICSHENKCDLCHLLRADAIRVYKKDFYITKKEQVYCTKCFLEKTGKILGDSRKNKWKKFLLKS